MTFRFNRIYIAFVVIVAGAGLGFVASAVTRQTYVDWANGDTAAHGFNWPMVAGIDLLSGLLFVALIWKVYCDSKICFGVEALTQPGLFGVKTIPWGAVTNVLSNGFGFHLRAGRLKIVVSPYAYAQPEAVIALLREKLRTTA